MPRGYGRANQTGETSDYFYSERWSMCEDKAGMRWFESANHTMQVKQYGDKYQIVTEKGDILRGKGHGRRTFKNPVSAMIAADKAAKAAS